MALSLNLGVHQSVRIEPGDDVVTPRATAAAAASPPVTRGGGGSCEATFLSANPCTTQELQVAGLQPQPLQQLTQQQHHSPRDYMILDEPEWMDRLVGAAACDDVPTLERMLAELGDEALTALMQAVDLVGVTGEWMRHWAGCDVRQADA